MDGLTICAANYIPFANTLAKSFLKFHPDSKFYLLLVDGDVPGMTFGLGSEITILKPSDLDLNPDIFMRMSIYYDVTELSTALKPLGLRYLLDAGSEIAIYLDPDIEVFSELIEIPQYLQSTNIALTPHTLHEIPRDGLSPSDYDIMASGIFNLGFIAIKSSSQSYKFLSWWNERLTFDCISDVDNNLFTDQRWIDFVPSYYSFSVIREYGYNVAYWNLHEREITKDNSVYYVNEKPLRFFHFSGYKPDKPWLLSSHVTEAPRVVMSDRPVLKEIAASYVTHALENGWETHKTLAYGFLNFKEDILLTPQIRRRYRSDLLVGLTEDLNLPPLPSASTADVLAWLNRQIPESGRLNVSLFDVWVSRPDLQSTFPMATSTDAPGMLKWAHKFGISEKVINESTIKIYDLPAASVNEKLLTHELGVNVSGYFNGEFGVGEFGRLVARAAIATSLPVTTLVNRQTESRQDEEFDFTDSNALFSVTIGSVNADQFEAWLAEIPRELRAHSKFIGVWAWEIESFPEKFFPAFELVDEVWAISNFVRDSIKKQTKKEVHVFPAPISAPKVTEKLDRSLIGLRDGEVFNLFMFDYFSVFKRKNPLDLISAHILAFPEGLGPKLVIKTLNGFRNQPQQDQLRKAALNRDDIIIVDAYVSREQLNSLLSECQVYISLHRSEGYGLTLAEAMALGKPVIATGYSGNMDFMNDKNSVLVPFELVHVGEDAFPYPKDSQWAQPDIEYAAKAIRTLSLDSNLRLNIGAKAFNDVTSVFTMQRAADFTRLRIETLHKRSVIQKLFKALREWWHKKQMFLKLLG